MVNELRRAHFRGRQALEMVFFGYYALLDKEDEWSLSLQVVRWLEGEWERVRRELREFPRVDQYGVELRGPGEEEEEEEVVIVEVMKKTEGSRKGKEKARNQ